MDMGQEAKDQGARSWYKGLTLGSEVFKIEGRGLRKLNARGLRGLMLSLFGLNVRVQNRLNVKGLK